MWGKQNQGFGMFGGNNNHNNQNQHHQNQNQGWGGNQQQQNHGWGGNQQQQNQGWGGNQQQNQWSSLQQPYTEWFVFKGRQSGKALDIDGGDKKHEKVILWEIHGGDNQLWTIESNGHGQCQIKSKTGTYLTVENNGSNNEVKICAKQNQHAPGQIFELVPVQGQQSTFYIKTFCGKCVDVYGNNKENGA